MLHMFNNNTYTDFWTAYKHCLATTDQGQIWNWALRAKFFLTRNIGSPSGPPDSLNPPRHSFVSDPPFLKFGTENCRPQQKGGGWYCVKVKAIHSLEPPSSRMYELGGRERIWKIKKRGWKYGAVTSLLKRRRADTFPI